STRSARSSRKSRISSTGNLRTRPGHSIVTSDLCVSVVPDGCCWPPPGKMGPSSTLAAPLPPAQNLFPALTYSRSRPPLPPPPLPLPPPAPPPPPPPPPSPPRSPPLAPRPHPAARPVPPPGLPRPCHYGKIYVYVRFLPTAWKTCHGSWS